jgi:hypothetical protein
VRMSERNFELSYVCFAITELLVSFLYDLSASQGTLTSQRLESESNSPYAQTSVLPPTTAAIAAAFAWVAC